jgi:hypothetical protein
MSEPSMTDAAGAACFRKPLLIQVKKPEASVGMLLAKWISVVICSLSPSNARNCRPECKLIGQKD